MGQTGTQKNHLLRSLNLLHCSSAAVFTPNTNPPYKQKERKNKKGRKHIAYGLLALTEIYFSIIDFRNYETGIRAEAAAGFELVNGVSSGNYLAVSADSQIRLSAPLGQNKRTKQESSKSFRLDTYLLS